MKIIISILIFISVVNAKFIRYDNLDVTIDTRTNLMWQDNNSTVGTDNKIQWSSALDYCEQLSLYGYSDWHLPNYNQLFSLADRNRVSFTLNSEFKYINSEYYWTSTTDMTRSDYAYFVHSNFGHAARSPKSSEYLVRCVRIIN